MSDIATDSSATAPATAPGISNTTTGSAPQSYNSNPIYRGKGGKGLGKGGAKRHIKQKKYDKDPLLGLTNGKIRQICQRSGIKRISGIVYEQIRAVIDEYCNDVMGYALCYTKHRRQETLREIDIVHASQCSGVMQSLYGFDDARITAFGNLTANAKKPKAQ